MASRAEQKARTRSALIDSWLRIIGGGANFASISLREVAKTAGVVPTSFYRHFEDLDEIGLAVVDQLGLDLRRLTRGSLDTDRPSEAIVHDLVAAYADYLHENPDLVRFVNQARTGGTPTLKRAIGNELESFAVRMAGSLGDVVPGLKAADRDTVAEVVLGVLLESVTRFLDLPASDDDAHEHAADELERRLRLVLLGASELAASGAPKTPAGKPRATKAAAARKSTTRAPRKKP